ncbi:MAG: hypothetical protein AB1758_29915, partial [Candidatus Eremiobacterota bacterium]
ARWARWSQSYTRLWQELLFRFLRQPLYLVMLELVAMFVGLWYLNQTLNPPILARTEPAAYVACEKWIYVISKASKEVITRIPAPDPVRSLAATPDGKKLLVATDRFLQFYNTKSNRRLAELPIDQDCTRIEMDPGGRWCALLHTRPGQVSLVQLDPEPLPEQSERRLKRKDTLIALLPAGRNAQGLAVDFPPVPDPTAVSPPREEPLKIYISTLDANQLYVYQAPPMQLVTRGLVMAPGALGRPASAPRTLLVALPREDHVAAYGVPGLQVQKTLIDLQGKQPMQFLFTGQDCSEWWCLNRAGTLSRLTPGTLTVTGSTSLGGTATAGCVVKGKTREEIWVTLEKGELVVVSATGGAVSKRVPIGKEPTSIWMVE